MTRGAGDDVLGAESRLQARVVLDAFGVWTRDLTGVLGRFRPGQMLPVTATFANIRGMAARFPVGCSITPQPPKRSDGNVRDKLLRGWRLIQQYWTIATKAHPAASTCCARPRRAISGEPAGPFGAHAPCRRRTPGNVPLSSLH